MRKKILARGVVGVGLLLFTTVALSERSQNAGSEPNLPMQDCPSALSAFSPYLDVVKRKKRQSKAVINEAVAKSSEGLKACASRGEACCQRYLAQQIKVGEGFTKDKDLALRLYLTAAKSGDLESNIQAARLAKDLGIQLSFDDYSGVRLIARREGTKADVRSVTKRPPTGDANSILDAIGDNCPQAYSAFQPLDKLMKREKRPSKQVLDDAFWKAAGKMTLCASEGIPCCQSFLAGAIEEGFGFTQDKNLSLQLYLTAAAGGDLDAKQSAERLSSELGIVLSLDTYDAGNSKPELRPTAANDEATQSDNRPKADGQPPNSSPVSAFIDLNEFPTTRSMEIARKVLYGSELDALQEARVLISTQN